MILHLHEYFVSLDGSLNPSFPSEVRIGIWALIANKQHIAEIRSRFVSTFSAPVVMEKIPSTEKLRQWGPSKNRIVAVKLPAEQRNRVVLKFSSPPAQATTESLD